MLEYYKNRFVCMPNDDTYALMEVSIMRKEAYIYTQSENQINIYVRDFSIRPIRDHEYIVPIKSFFEEKGIDDSEFKNPILRRKKIIKKLYEISKQDELVLKK